ncbi:carbohydrate ABC transporter permease [Microbacterium sp. CR_7]|uniref:carbohydrate ABC transporter permease n=1 Tax=Microbacterium sp. CR_7 TaxID=3055792 RepID=UPI0035C0B0A8
MRTRPLPLVLTYAAAAVVLVVYLAPLALILLNSVKTSDEASTFSFALPENWMFSNYTTVLNDPGISRALVNSVIIAAGVTVGTIFICSFAAYIIARRTDWFSRGVYAYLLVGLIAPFSVIPAIRVLQLLGLGNTHLGIILVDIASQIPFTTLLLVGFIRQIPRELDEAALIDGAGRFTIFLRIIFPLMRPVTLTVLVLVVTFAWNEFQNVLFLAGSDVWTLPMTIFNFQSLHSFDYALVSANLVVTALPMVVVFLVAQRYIMSGIMSGAVKS